MRPHTPAAADPEHGWTPYVWLIYAAPYVAWPFVGPVLLLGSASAGWVAWLAGLGVFLAQYFRGYWVDGRRRLPLIPGLLPLNP